MYHKNMTAKLINQYWNKVIQIKLENNNQLMICFYEKSLKEDIIVHSSVECRK